MDALAGGGFALALIVVTIAAGATLLRLGARARLVAAMPVGERWFLCFALGFGLTLWWAVLLAELGYFARLPLLVLPGVFAAVGLFTGRRPRVTPPRLRAGGSVEIVAILAILAVGATAYFPPFDVRLEARDPGVYYLTGVQLARTGAIVWEDPIIEEMSQQERDFWFPKYLGDRSSRYMGFYLPDVDEAWVSPQALPAHPALIGVGYLAAGQRGAEVMTPLVAILGTVGVLMLGARWLGPLAGAMGALVLAGGFVQGWFARYVAAELTAQLLVMAGICGLLLFRRHGDRAFGWLGAIGIGLALLTKAELLALAVPLAILLLNDALRHGPRRRELLHFWLPLGALGGHAAVHGLLWIRPYYEDLLRQANMSPGQFLTALAGASGAYVVLLLLLTLVRRRWGPLVDSALGARSPLMRLARPATVAALILAFCWAYWIRPSAFFAPGASLRQIRGWNAMNLVELGWAVSPAWLFLALAGFAMLLLEPRARRRGAALLILLVVVFLGLWNRQIIPQLPWAYRRWLPVVLPAVCLAGGYAVTQLLRATTRYWRAAASRPIVRTAAGGLAVACAMAVVATAAHQIRWTRAYGDHRELPGTERILAEVSAVLEPGALLIFEPRTRRGLDRFIPAMAIDRGFSVLQLRSPAMDTAMVRNAVLRFARRGQQTYLLTTGYLDHPWPIGGRRVHQLDFATRRLRPRSSISMARGGLALGPPLHAEDLNIEAQIFELHVGLGLTSLFAELDIGSPDDVAYLQGSRFNEVERDEAGRDFRWTTGIASMALPGMGGFARELIVRADPGTFRSLGDRTMTVSLDEVELGQVLLRPGWREYRFAIPAMWRQAEDDPPVLTIRAPSFRPRDDIPGLEDPRLLGLAIDKVGWQPVGPALER